MSESFVEPQDVPIAELKERVRQAERQRQPLAPVPASVLAVHRYLVGSDFEGETGEDPGEEQDVFDVVVTDGLHKIKCLLSPKLNHLVHRNELCAGCQVTLHDLTLRYNEGDVQGDSFIIIKDAKFRTGSFSSDDPGAIPNWSNALPPETGHHPLTGRWGHYLPLWNNEDPFGEQWEQQEGEEDENNDPYTDIDRLELNKLASKYKTMSRPYPVVVGRVLARARVHYYGKPGRDKEKWTYQGYIELGDSSGTASMVLWGSTVPALYKKLEVGAVVKVENYTVRHSFALRSRPDLHNNQLPCLNIELNINSRKPAAVVTVVPGNQVDPAWDLPDVKYKFVRSVELATTADQAIVDVVGLSTFVGRWERLRRPTCPQFWQSRWVHVMDQTSTKPVVLQLFATSQPGIHDNITAGHIVVATHMRVMQSTVGREKKKFVYLTTTRESQVYTTGFHGSHGYRTEQALHDLADWLQSGKARQCALSAVIGGCYGYPPLPPTLEEYKAGLGEEKDVKVTPLHHLPAELSSLHYCEGKRVVVQGTIAMVTYRPHPLEDREQQQNNRQERQNNRGQLQNNREQLQNNREQLRNEREGLQNERTVQNGAQAALTSTKPVPSTSHDLSSSDEDIFSPVSTRLRSRSQERSPVMEGGPVTRARSKDMDFEWQPVSLLKRRGRKDMRKAVRVFEDPESEDTGPKRKVKRRQQRPARGPTGGSSGQQESAGGPSEGEMNIDLELEPLREETNQTMTVNVTQLPPALPRLTTGRLHPLTTPRVWQPRHSDLAREALRLQPSELRPARQDNSKVEDMPVPNEESYYIITLLGLNNDVAVDMLFFPVRHGAHRTAYSHDHDGSFLAMLENGGVAKDTEVTDLGLPVREEVLDVRLVCVLDCFSHGGDNVELVLNRAYRVR
ncbi:RPA-related protein RADX-like [Branchiostoma lanceolatum]|uniref:RPA-related protein RADX-like n=1 Tax=Branchiostoma lanceolatum TaxID=7740 RepID=UPI0034549348